MKIRKDHLYIKVDKRKLVKWGKSLGLSLPALFVEKEKLEKGREVFVLGLLGGHILVVSDTLDWDFVNSEIAKLRELLEFKLDTGVITEEKKEGLF